MLTSQFVNLSVFESHGDASSSSGWEAVQLATNADGRYAVKQVALRLEGSCLRKLLEEELPWNPLDHSVVSKRSSSTSDDWYTSLTGQERLHTGILVTQAPMAYKIGMLPLDSLAGITNLLVCFDPCYRRTHTTAILDNSLAGIERHFDAVNVAGQSCIPCATIPTLPGTALVYCQSMMR